MYALVKQSEKYIIIQKQLIINKNKRMRFRLRDKSRNKRLLIACNNDAKLLETVQKNLNDNKPQVLIRRIEDVNNNLSITVPQIVKSNDENFKEISDISKMSTKRVCLTNTHVRLDEKQLDNEKSQSFKNQLTTNILKQNNSSYNIGNLGYNRYFTDFSTGKLNDQKEKENISFEDHQINLKNTVITDFDKNINDSFDSQLPIINDVLLHAYDDISFNIFNEQVHSATSLKDNRNNDKSSTVLQTDNSASQSKKCRILSDITLDKTSFNIIKNKTSFKICQRKKSNDLPSNNSSLLQYDNNFNFEMNCESLNDKMSFLQDVSNESRIVDTNIEDISSSKADPTYEPSQLDTTSEVSYANNNNEISHNNISTDKEKSKNVSPDKSNLSHNIESLNVQPGSCNDAGMFVASSLGRSGAGKKNFCLYCKTFQSKIHRHLQRKHKDEEDVQKFLDLPKNSIERRRIIDTIRRNGLDERTNWYKTPSNATNLGILLKQVGKTLITEYIKKCDNSKKEIVEDFLKLFVDDYAASVARTALETQSKQKRQKKTVLPTTEDISKLYNYLKKLRQSCYEKLKKKFSYDIWLTLAKTTLTTVLVFNRRRAGETERILIEEFNNRQAINERTNNELFKSLSNNNKHIAKKYVRFVTRGKKNRDVPVLLDFDLTQCILLLMEYRRYAKIHPRNPYLFALPGRNVNRFKFLRACQLLREFSHQCDAKIPTSLRGTKLRKHIATKCILLNLQGDEIEDLANYMGHAQNIHKEYYRQPIISRDILRMSQLLEKVQEDPNANEDEESDTDKEEENENRDEENTLCNAKSDLNPNDLYRMESSEPYATDSESSCDSNNTAVKRKRSTSPYGKIKRRRWSNEEQEIVMKLFGKYIKSPHLPSTQKILAAIKTHKSLQNRTAPQIRSWLHNQRKLNHAICGEL